jgi:glycosyltransferase involved in cell wall biosynthesis
VKKSVLIIVENLPVPFDMRVWKEASALQASGYNVTVLCPRGKGYRRGHEVIDGIHIYRHPMPAEGKSPLGYVREYTSALFWEFLYTWWIYFRRGFHVIQGCNPPDDIVLIALPFKILGVKYIFDHHDAIPELYLSKYGRQGFFYRIQVWLEKLTYRFSDIVMSTNSTYRGLAITRGGLDPEDVFIVRNGPELSFKAVQPNPTLKYGKAHLVGYVGTMNTQEGLDILLNVAFHIKNLGRRDVHFTCIGGGPMLSDLRAMVVDKDLSDMVNFTGRIPDNQLREILSTADVCVNPDKPCKMNDISTMIKIMEYMALGKPIVQFTSKEGRFSASEASLYAAHENQVPDFAAKILWLLDNPGERQKMGEFGRRRVEEELAWEYSVENLLAAYQRALGTGQSAKRVFAPARRTANSTIKASQAEYSPTTATQLLADLFRCPEDVANFTLRGDLSQESGYFRFGSDVICYGQCSSGFPAKSVTDQLHDASEHVVTNGSSVELSFNPVQVVNSLRCERYVTNSTNGDGPLPGNKVLRSVYYAMRPAMSVATRKHFQRLYFLGRDKRPFPAWPVDRTVENVFEQLLVLAMKSRELKKVPFIWFWPEGAPSCTILTHDVETSKGIDYCPQLMDLTDSFGIKSSFQIVPEKRYAVGESFLKTIRDRGFEINVHDLNHDGRLFSDRQQFLRRAERINRYAKQFGALGFRSAVMYRNTDWHQALDVSYDMSIPNVAHLDPQRGGCCTVLPFFVGKILELPVTTTQDYTLFHIMSDYSIRLWKQQISLIRQKHGLISFIIHPDYIIDDKARDVYAELLRYLSDLRAQKETWITLPREVDIWWRLRSNMKLVNVAGSWRIEGMGSERARLAYAVLDNDSVSYELAPVTEEIGTQHLPNHIVDSKQLAKTDVRLPEISPV